VYNGRLSAAPFHSFKTNLSTMREGEVRRVWVPGPRGGYDAYDLHLERVFKMDAKGEPIIDNR
jgi:hypothetical protein